jgi:hypothetical protein
MGNAGNLEHRLLWNTGYCGTLLAKPGGKNILIDLAEKVYAPDKTYLKINGAEGQPGQSQRVFQISRCSK